MTSGKKAREQRQAAKNAPPPVRRKGARASRQASPRVLAAAGAVAALIVVGIVLGVLLTRGSSSSSTDVPTIGSLATGLPEAGEVNDQFKGIPQSGRTLGRADAPVTLVEFIDLQCPYCAAFETQLFPALVSRYVRSGKLKVVIEPWAFIGPDSVRGQSAVLAAAEQNRAFNFASLLYYNQGTENTGWLNDDMVAAVAASIPGLRVHDLLDATGSDAVDAEAKAVDRRATERNVRGTPTLFVGRSGTAGRHVALKSPTDMQTLARAIASAQK
jgi:protein-disulfide isomerase